MQEFFGKVKRRLRRLFVSDHQKLAPVPAITADAVPASVASENPHYNDGVKTDEARDRIDTLTRLNETSDRPVTDPANAVIVSVTSHGPRLSRAHISLEAIAQGVERPGRLVLALSESDAAAPLSHELQSLVRRGLEIVVVADRFRVHSKYLGVVADAVRMGQPVIVADDDQLYPEEWLAEILITHRANPGTVVAQRAHQLVCDSETSIAPYLTWQPRQSAAPALSAFGTGVSGMLLPLELVTVLAAGNEDFLRLAPTADDIWLHSRAASQGICTVQVHQFPSNYEFVPGTQHVGLYLVNVRENANDPQIVNCYEPSVIKTLYTENEA